MNILKLFFPLLIVLLASCQQENPIPVDLQKTVDSVTMIKNNKAEIQIGVAAMLSPEEALPVYNSMIKYIGKKIGIKTKMIFSKDYSSMNKMVRTNKVVGAFVCAGPYASGHDKWGMKLLAAPVLFGKANYYSYIIVNKNSKIKTFADLREKKFAFTDPISNTGSLVPTYELAKINETPKGYFKQLIYSGGHDKSIEAVAHKFVDGAAVDQFIWEYMNKKHSPLTAATKIIKKIGPFCIPPFAVNSNIDKKLFSKMRAILLNMNKDPEGSAILRKIYIDKFIIVDDDCYNSVREMQTWVKKNKIKNNK